MSTSWVGQAQGSLVVAARFRRVLVLQARGKVMVSPRIIAGDAREPPVLTSSYPVCHPESFFAESGGSFMRSFRCPRRVGFENKCAGFAPVSKSPNAELALTL